MPMPDDMNPFLQMTFETRTVTCHTAGCPADGVALTADVAVGPNVGPITVVCSRCGKAIADVKAGDGAPVTDPGPDPGPDPE